MNHSSELNVNVSKQDDLASRRRAFIKGSALLLPAVLTLRNGSAFAAVSLTCLDKQAQAQPLSPPELLTAKGVDNFLRDETVCRTITPENDGVSFTVYQYPLGTNRWYPIFANSTSSTYYVEISKSLMQANSLTGAHYKIALGQDSTMYILAVLNMNGSRMMYNDATLGSIPIVGPKDNLQGALIASVSCIASAIHLP